MLDIHKENPIWTLIKNLPTYVLQLALIFYFPRENSKQLFFLSFFTLTVPEQNLKSTEFGFC
jgi:hypothetical protein